MPISTKATVFSGCKTLIVIFLPARSTFVQEAHYNKPRIYNDWHTLISQLRNNTWRGTGQEKSIGRGTVVPSLIGFLSCLDPCVIPFVTPITTPGMPQGRVIVTTFPGWGVTITTNSLYMARDYRKIYGSMDVSQVSSHVLVLLSHELTLPVCQTERR